MPQSHSIILISSLIGAALIVTSCAMDPVDPNPVNQRMGAVLLAAVDSSGEVGTRDFVGTIDSSDANDTTITVRGIGTFKHVIVLRDTSSGRHLRIYYTLPFDTRIRRDTARLVVHYKKNGTRAALLIKNKSDSLVCLFGTLLPSELQSVMQRAGAQNVRVERGGEAANSRVTDCGRAGDFNTLFFIGPQHVSLKPSTLALVTDNNRVYAVANIANTYLVKNLKNCPETAGEFAYAIVQLQ